MMGGGAKEQTFTCSRRFEVSSAAVWRWCLVGDSAPRTILTGVALAGIIGVAEVQAPPQDAPSVQHVSREQTNKIMRRNYKEFAALRRSAQRPQGYRWDTNSCTPDWAQQSFTRACDPHDFGSLPPGLSPGPRGGDTRLALALFLPHMVRILHLGYT
jgi:hypothetical protein